MASPDLSTTRQQILLAFAKGMFAKANVVKNTNLTHRERTRLTEAIGSDIRKACDLLAVVHVSERAAKEAALLGVNLRRQGWHDQPKFDRGRKLFHYEHVHTVSAIVKAVLEASSLEEVADVLTTRLYTAWILKQEDRELTKLGYRHHRPDPETAYIAAGIRLCTDD